jgi:hypothetical protein
MDPLSSSLNFAAFQANATQNQSFADGGTAVRQPDGGTNVTGDVSRDNCAGVRPDEKHWLASGNAADPYSWVPECPADQTCHSSVAAVVGDNLRVYGSQGAADVTTYSPNEHSMIDVVDVSRHCDANFESVQTPGREENYLGVEQTKGLFNVASSYRERYPADDPLVFTGGSTATGGSALDANGRPIHRSHRNGSNIDLRYMGEDGSPLTGNTAAANGSVERNQYIINQFAAQSGNLDAALTGNPGRYGLEPIPAPLQQAHRNHMHFQNNYPAVPQPPENGRR